MRTLFLTMIAALALGVCRAEDPGPRKGQKITAVNKTLTLSLVNEVRAKGYKCGDTYYPSAPPLKWNNLLEVAAAGHSNEMFDKKFFSHVGTDGSRAGDRIERAGYHWMTYGENIGVGYKNEKEVVEGWLSSPGHCKNIMKSEYKEMGVGRAGTYWTQAFGSK